MHLKGRVRRYNGHRRRRQVINTERHTGRADEAGRTHRRREFGTGLVFGSRAGERSKHLLIA